MKKNVFLAAALIALMAAATYAQTESDFQVTRSGNAATITGYTGSAAVVNIPSRIQNTPVTAIGEEAFAENHTITNVIIPSGVTSIGAYAFSMCTRLASVTIPNTVTRIESNAFGSCGVLASVTFHGTITAANFSSSSPFPSGLRAVYLAAGGGPGTYTKSGGTWTKQAATTSTVSESDFQVTRSGNAITITKYNGRARDVIIPATIQGAPVTVIGDSAFRQSEINSVTIPNSVTRIANSAFTGSVHLTSVTIGSGVTNIDLAAFRSCSSLVSVTFQGTIPRNGLNSDAFDGDLFTKYNAGGPGTYRRSGLVWTKQ